MLIGFAGGFRRSELVSIEYEDIDFVNEGVKIQIKRFGMRILIKPYVRLRKVEHDDINYMDFLIKHNDFDDWPDPPPQEGG